jgi:hypothetical protein
VFEEAALSEPEAEFSKCAYGISLEHDTLRANTHWGNKIQTRLLPLWNLDEMHNSNRAI